MKVLGVSLFLTGVLAVATACSGSSAPSGPTAAQACGSSATTQCQKLMTCSATLFAERYPDMPTCVSRLTANCTTSLAAASTGNNASYVEACVAAYPAWACSDYLLGINTPAACVPHQGMLANGAACAFSAQCQSTYCSVGTTSVCGTCTQEPRPGDSCATTSCGPNLNCTKAMTCAAPAGSGAPCNTTDTPCQDGLVCVGSTASAMGTCQTAVATAGAACNPANKTGPSCDSRQGLSCNSMTKVCDPVTPAAPSAPCGTMNDDYIPCAAEAFCNNAAGMAGTCVPAAADGAACDTAAGPNCQLPAKCVTSSGTSGTCQLPGSAACH